MDNSNTHPPGSLYEAFAPEKAKALWERFEFIYMPKHGSWVNTAEIEINVMVSQCLSLSRRIDSIETVRSEVAALAGSTRPPSGKNQLAVHHQGGPGQAQTALFDNFLMTRHWFDRGGTDHLG